MPDLDGKPPSGWTIYQVKDSPTVQALQYQPVVATGMQSEPSWKCEGVAEAAPTPAAPRPSSARGSAPRCRGSPILPRSTARSPTTVPRRGRGPRPPRRSMPRSRRSHPVDVSNIRTTESSIEFDVSRTGVPVMVKTSWYPNWKAEGANGPWRATPNFMVVVPTSKHVKLTFATATVDWVGRVLTVVGLVGLGGLVWWGMATRGNPTKSPSTPKANLMPKVRLKVWNHGVGGYDSRPALRGEDPRLQCPTLRSTPSSRPMTFAGSIPTSSTSRSPVGSATPSSRSPGRPACSSAATPGRRRPRWSRRSPRARSWPAPTSSTSGVASTDLCYFAAGSLDAPAAMFTASHNPAEYNGVKLCRAGALPIGQDTGLAEIKAMVAGGLLERAEDPGRTESRDLLPAFVAHVHSFVDLDALAPLRVVADTANGVGGRHRPRGVRRAARSSSRSSSASSTARSPNHPADPTNTENLKDLQTRGARRRRRGRPRVRRRRRPRGAGRRPGAADVGIHHHRDAGGVDPRAVTRASRWCTT